MLVDVKIVPGGKLIATRWNSKTEQREEIDATDYLFYHFSDEVEIGDGVVLKDLMLLVKSQCHILSPLLTKGTDTLEKIIEEGLGRDSESDNLDYLELSWASSVDNFGDEGSTQFYKYVSCDGIGKDEPGDKFGIDFTPTYKLAKLPIKLNTKFKVYDERKSMANAPVLFEASDSFTLYEVLRGVFWELSFYGDPEDRKLKLDELRKSIKDIEEGTVELIPWEDVKARLDETIKGKS